MADTNNLKLTITADNKASNQAFAQTNQALDQMAAQAVKVAQSISQHFQQMAREIQAAISGLNGAFSGLDSASRGIVNQYGRPMASGSSPSTIPPIGIAANSGRPGTDMTINRFTYPGTLYAPGQQMGKFTRLSELKELRGATDGVGQSFAGGMIKAVAFYEVLQKGVETLKALTVESAHAAAAAQMYGTAMHVSAESNGVTGAEVDALEKDLRSKGITRQESRKSIIYAMTADLDLSGMPQLAKMAKGLTAMNPESNTSDNLQSIIEAISSGQVRGLRRQGVYGLDFNYAERQYALNGKYGNVKNPVPGRPLDEILPEEQARVREAEVLRVSDKYAAMGAHLDPLQQAMSRLSQASLEAKVAIGEGLLPVMLSLALVAQRFTYWIAAHPAVAKAIGLAGVTAAGAAGGAVVGSIVPGVGTGIGAVVGGMTGLLGGAAAMMPGDPVTAEQRQAAKDAESKSNANAAATKLKNDADDLQRIHDRDVLKNQEETRAAIKTARKTSADLVEESRTKGLEGRYAIEATYDTRLKQMETRVDSQGNVRHFNDPQIEANVNAAKQLDVSQARTKMIRDLNREVTAEAANQLEGGEKLNALHEIAVKKIRDEGWATADETGETNKLIRAQEDLTQAKMRAAVIDEARSTRDSLERARVSDQLGYAQISADAQLKRDVMARKDISSPEAVDNINAEAEIKRNALARSNRDELDLARQATGKTEDDASLQAIEMAKESKLSAIEATYTFDLKAKLNAEQAKYAIELQYLGLISDKRKEIREGDYNDELSLLNKRFYRGELTQVEYDSLRKERSQQMNNDLGKMDSARSFDQAKLLKDTTHNQREMLQAEYTTLYDKLKGSVSSVFDSIFDRNRSFLDSLAQSLKNFFQKLAVDIISTQVTKGLMGALTGQEVQTVSPGAGVMKGGLGVFSSFFGGLTGRPIIRGGGTQQQQASPSEVSPSYDFTGFAHGPLIGSLGGAPRMPGSEFGLPGVATLPISDSTVNQVVTTGAQANSILFPGSKSMAAVTDAMKANQKGAIRPSVLDNIKSTNWGSIRRADGTPGVNGQPGTDHTAGKMTGVDGVAGQALQAGGMMLATEGLMGNSRGTWTGVAEGAAGGAMIGLQAGGPIGAAIGGATGFFIGIGEKIAGVESQRNEAIRLVKQIYNLKLNAGTADEIVKIAKSKYGNSVSVAVRSSDVRQLLQLYAESTGQKSNLYLNDPHGVSLSQTANGLQQSAVFHNGSALTYSSSLSTLGIGGTTIPTGNPFAGGNVTVAVSAEQTENLWSRGVAQGIASNGRNVASANVSGGTASASRINAANMMMNPDMVYA